MPSISVVDWLRDQVVLITGATGFIGNNLLFKLIDSKSSVKKVYLLVRNGKNISASERIIKSVQEQGYSMDKIQILSGDITQPNFGLEENVIRTITSEINVIYHLAASISFNLKLDRIVEINVRGTKNILEFATRCCYLNVFLYCSTAFCKTTPEDLFQEKIYPAPMDPMKVLSMSKEELHGKTQQVLSEGWPNTYAWSKAVTEQLVASFSHCFPITIVRPSLVFPAQEFPYPGWSLNQCPGTTICLLSKFGINKFWKRAKTDYFNVLPVDVIANGCILASWQQANKNTNQKNHLLNNNHNVYVVNLVNCHKDYFNISSYVSEIGNIILIKRRFLFYILMYLFEIFPLSIISIYNSSLKKIHYKLNYINNSATYYMDYNWNFESSNFQNLKHLMKNKQDKKIFSTEIDSIQEKYFRLTINSSNSIFKKCKQENNNYSIQPIYTMWLFIYCLIIIFGLIFIFMYLF